MQEGHFTRRVERVSFQNNFRVFFVDIHDLQIWNLVTASDDTEWLKMALSVDKLRGHDIKRREHAMSPG